LTMGTLSMFLLVIVICTLLWFLGEMMEQRENDSNTVYFATLVMVVIGTYCCIWYTYSWYLL